MKKLLFIALVAIAFASCEKDETKAFKINATDKISIKPSTSVAKSPMQKVSSVYTHLSALEIVKQADGISFTDTIFNIPCGIGYSAEQRDTISETPKLLMWATNLISLEGVLKVDGLTIDTAGSWIQARDIIINRKKGNYPNEVYDTIAYIPNNTIRIAEKAIRSAYVSKDIDACYALFNNAYTFTPITGAEWRALKAQGLQ